MSATKNLKMGLSKANLNAIINAIGTAALYKIISGSVNVGGETTNFSAKIAAINAAIASLGDTYVSGTAYPKGKVVIKDGGLVRAKQAIASGESWTASHWESITIQDEVKEAVDAVEGKITFGSDWYDGSGGVHYAEEAGLAEGIATDRTIDNPEDSCPPITFGTVGGEAEIQTGINKFQTLFGNSFKYNQLYSPRLTFTQGGVTFTKNSDGSFTLSGKATEDIYARLHDNSLNGYNGHKLAIAGYNETGCTVYANANPNWYPTFPLSIWSVNSVLSNVFLWIYIPNGTDFTTNKKVRINGIFDLTDMDIDTNDVDEAIAILKSRGIDVNQYLPYSTPTILDAQTSELESVGENAWDEVLINGYYNTTTGLFVANNSYRASNKIEVLPNTEYFIVSDVELIVLAWDANGNLLDLNPISTDNYIGISNGSFTTPSNCKHIAFWKNATELPDISIYVEWDTPNRPYVKHKKQVVALPNIPLRSVPNYADPDNPIRDVAYQIGGGKRRVGHRVINSVSDGAIQTNCYRGMVTLTGARQFPGTSNEDLKAANGSILVNCDINTSVVYSETIIPTTLCVSRYYSNDIHLFICAPGCTTKEQLNTYLASHPIVINYELAEASYEDIPLSENPGWVELVYTDNYGTLRFNTDPAQNPQVPQPYFIEYTISLTEFLDSVYVRANGDANTIVTEDELDAIRGGNDVVGKAKLADNLESNNKTALLSAYVFGQSPTGKADSMLMDKIVGGDVAFNQLVKNGNFEDTNGWTAYSATLTASNNIITATKSGSPIYFGITGTRYVSPITANHVYLIVREAKADASGKLRGGLVSVIDDITDISANTWIRFATAYKPASSSNGTPFNCYIENTTATTLQIRNVQVYDLTQMFGTAIANYLLSLGSQNCLNKFRLLFPKAYYPYNAGELLPVRTVGRKAVGINMFDKSTSKKGYSMNSQGEESADPNFTVSDYINVIPGQRYYFKDTASINNRYCAAWFDGSKGFISLAGIYDASTKASGSLVAPANAFYLRLTIYNEWVDEAGVNIYDTAINGTFYPYVENTYPVEDVALHGIFILDSGNNIVTDGDEYPSSGQGKRLYEKVKLGDLTFTKVSSATIAGSFNATLPHQTASDGDTQQNVWPVAIISNGYAYGWKPNTQMDDKTFRTAGGLLRVCDSAFNNYTGDQVKAALADVYVVYKMLEEEPFEATPYASTQVKGTTQQWLEPEWTEEETPIMVPVGNQATLFDDLKKKVEIAADMPADDGTYVLNKSGGSNTYTPLDTWLGNNGYEKVQDLSEGITAVKDLTWVCKKLYKMGNVVIFNIRFTLNETSANLDIIAKLPSGAYQSSIYVVGSVGTETPRSFVFSNAGNIQSLGATIASGTEILINGAYVVA